MGELVQLLNRVGLHKGRQVGFQRGQQGGFLTAAGVEQVQPLLFGVKDAQARLTSSHRMAGGFDLAQLDAVAHMLDLEILAADVE